MNNEEKFIHKHFKFIALMHDAIVMVWYNGALISSIICNGKSKKF